MVRSIPKVLTLVLSGCIVTTVLYGQVAAKPATFANPINFDYGSERSTRRAAEPVVIIYKDDYYLFQTAGNGLYWYSSDMREWTTVRSNLPGGVPSLTVIGDSLYFAASQRTDLWATDDPKSGVWRKAAVLPRVYGDAALFADDDGRIYMYYGWSDVEPIRGVELDPKNSFREIGQPVDFFWGNEAENGWQRRRLEDLPLTARGTRKWWPEETPWTEGPWMSKFRGKYYLQFAGGGVSHSSYADGVYVGDHPLGPFKYLPTNPLSAKPTGFVTGAGHGMTFQDKLGNYWRAVTMVTSYQGSGTNVVGFFPADIDADGILHTNTEFGDFPLYLPGTKPDAIHNSFTGWMLLSRDKLVSASSFLRDHPFRNAVDENSSTYWAAKSGNPGEYLTIDLGRVSEIHALQVNLDVNGGTPEFQAGAVSSRYQSYTVHVSEDNQNWLLIVDKSNNTKDQPYDYLELAKPVMGRYVKLTNVFTPGGANFAVKDLRVFGDPKSAHFEQAHNVTIMRDPNDRRDATVSWQPVKDADGYIVRYGIARNKLYNNYLVYDDTSLRIHSLDRDPEYYFEVEAFGTGTQPGTNVEISLWRDGHVVERKSVFPGTTKYYFQGITPGSYSIRLLNGGVWWQKTLQSSDVVWASAYPGVPFDKATAETRPKLTEVLFNTGRGIAMQGQVVMRVVPGSESGTLVLSFEERKQ